MSGGTIGSVGERSIGWGNEGRVNAAYAARVKAAFEQATANGVVTLVPLSAPQVRALEAKMQSGTKGAGDRYVDFGDGKQLIQRDGKIYLREGSNYSSVRGFEFPPQPMASPMRR